MQAAASRPVKSRTDYAFFLRVRVWIPDRGECKACRLLPCQTTLACPAEGDSFGFGVGGGRDGGVGGGRDAGAARGAL